MASAASAPSPARKGGRCNSDEEQEPGGEEEDLADQCVDGGHRSGRDEEDGEQGEGALSAADRSAKAPSPYPSRHTLRAQDSESVPEGSQVIKQNFLQEGIIQTKPFIKLALSSSLHLSPVTGNF